MIKINENYLKLQASYLFADIAKKVAAFQADNPERGGYKTGVSAMLPRSLPPACIEAFHQRR